MCTFPQRCVGLLPSENMNVFNSAFHKLGHSYDPLYDQVYQLDSFALYHALNRARCSIGENETVGLLMPGAGYVLQREGQGWGARLALCWRHWLGGGRVQPGSVHISNHV